MVPVGDEQRHEHDVVALEEVGEVVDLGVFVHVQRADLVEPVAVADPVGVVLDGLRGVLVAFGAVSDDREADPLADVGVAGDRLGPTDDHVGHRLVGSHRSAVVDLSVDVFGDERGVVRREAVGVPLVDVPVVEPQLAGNHLLGEVSLRDEQRDDVHVVALDGAEHLAEVWLFFPEAGAHLVERAGRADRVGVCVRRCARVGIQV